MTDGVEVSWEMVEEGAKDSDEEGLVNNNVEYTRDAAIVVD
jgi:hypothetical protein